MWRWFAAGLGLLQTTFTFHQNMEACIVRIAGWHNIWRNLAFTHYRAVIEQTRKFEFFGFGAVV